MSYKLLGSYSLASNVTTYTMQDWSTAWGQLATTSPYDRIEIWYNFDITGTSATIQNVAWQFTDQYGSYGTSITWTDAAQYHTVRQDGLYSGFGASSWGGLLNGVYNNGNAVGLQGAGLAPAYDYKSSGVITIYNTKNLNSSPVFLSLEGTSVYDTAGSKQFVRLYKTARNTSGLQLICGVKVGIESQSILAGSQFAIYGIK